MDTRLRSMLVRAMLSAYRTWKHPKDYYPPKLIQQAKDDYHRNKKTYKRLYGKEI